MATTPCCTPCPETTTVNVPGIQGPQGEQGPAGADGAPGLNLWFEEFGGDILSTAALTSTPAAIGGASPILLTDAGDYILMATVHLKWNAATTLVNHLVTLNWRRLNHTPADISPAGASVLIVTPIVTNEDSTLGFVPITPFVYTALANDIVDVFGSIDSAPYSGSLDHAQIGMVAIKLGT